MEKPGPSPEYRDVVKGRISPEEYVRKVRKDVGKRVGVSPSPRGQYVDRRAAAS